MEPILITGIICATVFVIFFMKLVKVDITVTHIVKHTFDKELIEYQELLNGVPSQPDNKTEEEQAALFTDITTKIQDIFGIGGETDGE